MSKIAIGVESLGKRYRIGSRERYHTMRDRLTNALSAPARWLSWNDGRACGKGPNYIWALRDVSFELQEGEVLGLVGRNGAGKTTLLKILSRVTKPTEGRAEIRGRIGSLLEVGTGFHPELTGRENTYLNGAILGMAKKEIDRKFEDIVAFSEVSDFIDTPLKHYSSGMQMRLAFAVAAHFEPQILLVDEVLAVGDMAFQKKCLAKMDEVAHEGRTIVFVTHQMNQIRRLCSRVIWVEHGTIRMDGKTSEVVGAYEDAQVSPAESSRHGSESLDSKARFLTWDIVEPRGEHPNVYSMPGPIAVRFVIDVREPIPHAHLGVNLYDGDRRLLLGNAIQTFALAPGMQQVVFEFPDIPIKPGVYYWSLTLLDESGVVDRWQSVPNLLVATPPVTHYLDEWVGILNIPWAYTVSPFSEDRTRPVEANQAIQT